LIFRGPYADYFEIQILIYFTALTNVAFALWFTFWKKTKNFLIFPHVFSHGLLVCTKNVSSDTCQIIIDEHLPFNTVLCNQFNLNWSKNNLGLHSCMIGVSKALFVGFPFCHPHNIFIETKYKT
jgi:hypothetical protein